MFSCRPRSLRPAALAAAAALGATVLWAAPAQAARSVAEDGIGDMWKINEGGTDPWAAPAATNGDIVRTTFRHTSRRVIVRTTYTDLAPSGKRFRLWVDVRDQSGKLRTLGLDASPANRAGEVIIMDRNGRDLVCRGMRHVIDYVRDVTRLSVPRRCLDAPRTVEFRVLSEHVRRSWEFAWLDNGLSASMDDRSWTEPLRRS